MQRGSSARSFFTVQELETIKEAISRLEAQTSAEVRIHLEDRCPDDAMARAKRVFEELGMTATAERNGVLLYLATKDRKLAIIGDQGIDQRVVKGFWNEIVCDLTQALARGERLAGILAALERIGQVLARFFPPRPDDVNELSDEVSIGD